MEAKIVAPGGEPAEVWQLHAGDYIRVSLADGTQATARVTAIDRGPGHEPGCEGLDWECAWPQAGTLDMPSGHAEMGAHDPVTRVWATAVAA
jgi:hypothetical protein